MHKAIECFLLAIAPVSASEPRSSTSIVDTSLKRFCFAKPSQTKNTKSTSKIPFELPLSAKQRFAKFRQANLVMYTCDIMISYMIIHISFPHSQQLPLCWLPSGIGPTVWLLEGPMPIFKSSLVKNCRFLRCCETNLKFTGPRCKDRGVNWIDERTLALCALNEARCIKQRLGSESSVFAKRGIKTNFGSIHIIPTIDMRH